jgi:hypothetical protein
MEMRQNPMQNISESFLLIKSAMDTFYEMKWDGLSFAGNLKVTQCTVLCGDA